MNDTIEKFTRQEILEKLQTLPESYQRMFLRMYNYSVSSESNNPADYISETVSNLPTDKLDWALTQIENSIKKLQEKNSNDNK
jgi:hypothetical protein